MVLRTIQQKLPIIKKVATYTLIVAFAASVTMNYAVLTTANEWMEANANLRVQNYQVVEQYRYLEEYCTGMTGY